MSGRAGVLAAVAVLLAAASAAAERDYDFAKALWQAGFRDLAVQQYRKVLAIEGISPDEKARAHLDLSTIFQEEADLAADPEERRSLLAQAQAELPQALAAAQGNVVLAFAARQRQAMLLQDNARYLARLMGLPDFQGDRVRTRAEALTAFDESVKAFQALDQDAKALILRIEKEAKPGFREVTVGLQNERVNAGLRGMWSEYYAALLFGKSERERGERLDRARQGFAAFAKEWDGYLVSLYGHVGEGACLLELGEQPQAQAKFSLVISAARDRATREVAVQALIYRATSYNATDQPTRAVTDLDAALASFRQPERLEIGRQALVERAKALEKLAQGTRGNRPNDPEWRALVRQALGAARSVAERPGPYGREAEEVVTRLLTGLGVEEAAATSAEALAVAESAAGQKRYDDALAGYRQAIALDQPASGGNGAAAVRAWFGIGRSHYFLKHYLEAAIVFEHVGRSFPQRAEGPRAAYLAVQCWMQAYGESKQQADRRASMRSLAEALERYGSDPRIGDLRVIQGQLLLQEGRYQEALRAFQAVPEGSSGYARAQYEAGVCAWDHFLNLFRRNLVGEDKGRAQYEPAAAHLKTYLRLVEGTKDDEEKERIGNARLVLATIHNDLIGDAKTALGFLQYDFPAHLRVEAQPLRLKALIQERRVEEALALLKEIRATAGTDPQGLEQAMRLLGNALDDEAQAIAVKGDRPAYLAAAKRTADFLLAFLRENPDQDAEMYQFVASRLIRIERFQEASDVLRQLIERFGQEPKNDAAVLGARLSLVECLMGAQAWTEAVQQLKGLQEKYPESARLRALLATCHLESGSPDQAIPILRDLFLNIYREGTRPWYEVGLSLARAYERAGKRDLALGVTSHVKLLHAPFWAGQDAENLDLVEPYKELHRRCGGQE